MRHTSRYLLIAAILLSCAPFCSTFRNMSDPSRLVLGTVMSLSSTTRSDGTILDADSSGMLQGYRFWAERTNDAGGVMVNGQPVPVELVYYNDESDPGRTEQLYQQLVDDGVDVLLGGLAGTTKAMARVSKERGIVAMACFTGVQHELEDHPLLFRLAGNTSQSISTFLEGAASEHTVRRLGILKSSETESTAGHAGAFCEETTKAAQHLGIDIVFEGSIAAPLDGEQLRSLFVDLSSQAPEAVVACTSGTDSIDAVHAAVAALVLQGSAWPGSQVSPGWVDSPFLKFLLLTSLPDRTVFTSSLGGFVHGVVSPQQWHHTLNFSDPFFGSTSALDAEWMQRKDFGRGEHLDGAAAAAVAAGVVLRSALEQGGAMHALSLQHALSALDTETFYGRVRMASGETNTALSAGVVTQWDCSAAGPCTDRIILPPLLAHADLRVLPPSCARGSLRELVLKDGQVQPTCIPCMAADVSAVKRTLEADGPAAAALRSSCEALGSEVRIGVVAPVDAQMLAAMHACVEWVNLDPTVLPNIHVALTPVPNTTEPENAIASQRLAALVSGSRPDGEDAIRVALGNGVAVSFDVAAALQGRAMALVLKEFGWTVCHLVTCSTDACRAMAAEFKRDAALYGIKVDDANAKAGQTAMPTGDQAAMVGWLEKRLQVDVCSGQVLVLCVDETLAQAVTDQMRQDDQLQRVVVVGSEALTRVENPLPGSIAIRLSAETAAWDNRSAATWSTMLTELESRAWAEENVAWVQTSQDWKSVAAVAVEACDAVVWTAKLLDAKLGSDATFSGNETLMQDIRATEHYGLSGQVAFRSDLHRSSGRMGLVVHRDGKWVQSAIWDTANPASLLFDTERYASLELWIESEVSYHEDGIVLPDCPCVVWTRMPPGSSILTCTWSPEAISVAVVASIVVALLVVFCTHKLCKRRFEDAETRAIYAQMQRLRKLLGLQKRRGFMLSSEQENTLTRAQSKSLWHYTAYTIIPRKYLEALAKMSLLLPFEMSMMDQFCYWLYSLDSNGRRRSIEAQTMQPAGTSMNSMTNNAEPDTNWRYNVLCQLVLDTSAQLLSPDEDDEDEDNKDDELRADVSRPNTPLLTSRQSWDGCAQLPETQEERFKYFKDNVGHLRIWGYRDGKLFRDLKDVVQSFLNDIHYRLHARYVSLREEDGGQELVTFEWDDSKNEWWLRDDAAAQFRGQAEVSPTHEGEGSDLSMRSEESGGGSGAAARRHERHRYDHHRDCNDHHDLTGYDGQPGSVGTPGAALRRHLLPSLVRRPNRISRIESEVEAAQQSARPEPELPDSPIFMGELGPSSVSPSQQGTANKFSHGSIDQEGSYKELIRKLTGDGSTESGGLQLRLSHVKSSDSTPGNVSPEQPEPPSRMLEDVGKLASLTPTAAGAARSWVLERELSLLSTGEGAVSNASAHRSTPARFISTISSPNSTLNDPGPASPLAPGGRLPLPGVGSGVSSARPALFAGFLDGFRKKRGSTDVVTDEERQEQEDDGISRTTSAAVPVPVALQKLQQQEPELSAGRRDRSITPRNGRSGLKIDASQKTRWKRLKQFAVQSKEEDQCRRVQPLNRLRRHSGPVNRKSSTASNASLPSPSGSDNFVLAKVPRTPGKKESKFRRYSADLVEMLQRRKARHPPSPVEDPARQHRRLPLPLPRAGSASSIAHSNSFKSNSFLLRRVKAGAEDPKAGAVWLKKLTSFRTPWNREAEDVPPSQPSSGMDPKTIADAVQQEIISRAVQGRGAAAAGEIQPCSNSSGGIQPYSNSSGEIWRIPSSGSGEIRSNGAAGQVTPSPTAVSREISRETSGSLKQSNSNRSNATNRPLFRQSTGSGSRTDDAQAGQNGSAQRRALLRQDHPLVRAIRVDEQDEAEAQIEWEVEETGKGGSPRRVVDEDVFISQLHRRAELLNDGFVKQVRQIVEHHRPTELATSSQMGKIKALAWLDTAQGTITGNSQTRSSPPSMDEVTTPKSTSTVNAIPSLVRRVSFSKRPKNGAGPRPLEISESTAHVGMGGVGPHVYAHSQRNLRPPLGAGVDLDPPSSASTITAHRGSVLNESALGSMTGATTGMRLMSDLPNIDTPDSMQYSRTPVREYTRTRLKSEPDTPTSRLPDTYEGPPAAMARSVSTPLDLVDDSTWHLSSPDSSRPTSRATGNSSSIVNKIGTGFARLRRQSSLMVTSITGNGLPLSPPRPEPPKRPPRLKYSEMLDRRVSELEFERQNSEGRFSMLEEVTEQDDSRSTPVDPPEATHRVSSDPARIQPLTPSNKTHLRLWTSLGRLGTSDEPRASGESVLNGHGTSLKMIKVQDLASSHTSDHPHQPWPKQWKGALKHVIPRRTKAAFRRLSSIKTQCGALADLVRREEWRYRVIAAPVKTKERMREKLMEYAKRGDPMRPLTANILDPIRTTVVCDGPRQILAAVNWFLNNTDPRLPAMPIVRVKNKFSMEDASEYDGYRDLMICVIHTGKKGLRIIGEIQFHDAKLHALKVKMHKLYKVKRAEGANLI